MTKLSDKRVQEIADNALVQWDRTGHYPGDDPGPRVRVPEAAALAREVVELREILRVRDAVLDAYPAPDTTGPTPRPMGWQRGDIDRQSGAIDPNDRHEMGG